MLVWVPAVLVFYGPLNFLWICNVCNFVLLLGLWRESSLLVSSQLAGVLLLDAVWTLDVAGGVLLGEPPLGATGYMFDAAIPLHLRLLSLYHSAVPLVILWATLRLGYHPKGLWLQSAITSLVLPVTLLLSPEDWNINWVHGPFEKQHVVPPLAYVAACIVVYPLLIYGPVHVLARRWLPAAQATRSGTGTSRVKGRRR